jgi:hypothetical protein
VRVARLAGIILLLSAAAGCKQQRIDVVAAEKDRTGDYGRQALRVAVDKFRTAPRSPDAYRALAVEIERLRPAFTREVSDEAERDLVFLALGPMTALADRPLDEQLAILGVTVWPTALHVEPRPGETAEQLLERACGEKLAAECKYVVPEYWPLVLSQRVWRRLKNRARDAYGKCRPCAREPSYAALLEEYDQHDSRMTKLAREAEDRVERSAWPQAGDNAEEWSGAPVLDLVPDPPTLAGEPISGDWAARLRANQVRPHGQILGLHLRPRSDVRHLRAVLRAAHAAGYDTVALQARRRDFPYRLAQYRLTTRGAARPVAARDIDSIQYLVRVLDAAAAHARPLRLAR